MTSHRFLAVIVSVSVFLAGCAGNVRVKIDPSNPVYQPKNEFETNYGLLITPDERKIGYTVEMFPALPEPIRPFDKIDTLDEFRKFEKHFWDIRDTDPNTPQNEYKELKDSWLRNIQNEIFATDQDVPGTRFDANGGLKGDLARVYLLWGMPTFKDKLSENTYHVEMIVWYYLDYEGRVLMSFLFYEKYNRLTVFRNQESASLDLRYALEEITRTKFMSDEELQEVWYDLAREDSQWLFRSAMFRFSDYDRLDKDTRWTIDKALAPPEPAALTARRFKPTILGQPEDLTGREFISSSYRSFIPSKLEINAVKKCRLVIGYADVDWEIKGDMVEAVLDIRVSFQNKKTKDIKEFLARLTTLPKSREEVEEKIKGILIGNVVVPVVMDISIDDVYNFAQTEESRQTLRQLIDDLEPGEYIVNAYLRHAVTKKNNAWREEIVISR